MSEQTPTQPLPVEAPQLRLQGAVATLSPDGVVTLTWVDPPRLADPNAVTLPQRLIAVELGPATIVQLDEPDELED